MPEGLTTSKALELVFSKQYQLEEAIKELAYAIGSVADTQRGYDETMTKSLEALKASFEEAIEKAIGVKAAAGATKEGHAMVSGLKTPEGMAPTASGAPDTKEVMPVQIPAKETKENDESIYSKERKEVVKRVTTASPDVGALTASPATPKNPLNSVITTILSPETSAVEKNKAIKAVTFPGGSAK